MTEADKRPIGQWTADEAAREEAATSARIERDRQLGAEQNVRAAAALARFANRVADAAASARQDGSARS